MLCRQQVSKLTIARWNGFPKVDIISAVEMENGVI